MSNRQRAVLIVVTIFLVLAIPLGRSILFTVDERELAVVLQFGNPVRSYTEPGLKFKVPFVEEVRKLPKTYQFWTGAQAWHGGRGEVLENLPTADGNKVEVTPWAVWRITDPEQFVRVVREVGIGEDRVKDFVRSAARDVITSNDLAEVVRNTDRPLTYSIQVEPPSLSDSTEIEKIAGQEDEIGQPFGPQLAAADKQIEVGREEIVLQIKTAAQERLLESEEEEGGSRGIELVDVGIAKIDFVDSVREEAFERLIAFMNSIAARHENEGERLKQEILNRTEAEVQKIEGEGAEQAARTRGEADAKITEMYADAIRETGEFYKFIRILEAYDKAMGENTRMILTTDSSLLQMLKDIGEAEVLPDPSTAAPGEAAAADTEEAAAPGDSAGS